MKNLLTIVALAAVSTASASADTLLSPDFSGATIPAGYTATNANGGSETYPGNGTMTSSDFSVTNAQAYISATDQTPNSTAYDLQATFTPSYNSSKVGGDYVTVPLLGLYTTGGNDDLVDVSLIFNSFVDSAQVNVNSGIEYSGTTTGDSSYTGPTGGLNALSGNTYTVNDVVTFSVDTADGTAEVYNNGTLSTGGNVVYTFDTVTTGNTVNGDSFEPATNPLTLKVGIINANVDSGFFDTGASITYSDASVSSVTPEPSSYALLLGGLGALVWFARRRAIA
jgi:hypothetical protein